MSTSTSTAIVAAVVTATALWTGGCAGSSTRTSSANAAQRALTDVTTNRGVVRGVLAADHLRFLGIPYAAPPVRGLRWKPPRPHPPWTGVRPAVKMGPRCTQLGMGKRFKLRGSGEDCLTLNVWTPHPRPARGAPVMVWIHGGGFVNGGSSIRLYSGRRLAATTGRVVVSINYRLGPFGFLAHPAFGAPRGNYGIMDQQAALRWVRDNIAAFGGDPGNVTIFGESAGAMSVCLHLVAPASRGLFHRAIMQSGFCLSHGSPAAAASKAGALAKALGCGSGPAVAACLRSKSTASVLKALRLKKAHFHAKGVQWFPTFDGTTIPAAPLKLIRAGRFNKVPLILGSNKDEGTIFTLQGGLMWTRKKYIAQVRALFGDRADDVLKRYPVTAYRNARAAFSDMFGDAAIVCPTRRAARAHSGAGARTYLYHFSLVPAFSIKLLGALHGVEIPFVFNNYPFRIGKFRKKERALSRMIGGYWTRFAATGDPNQPGAPRWSPYRARTDRFLRFDTPVKAGVGLKKSQCDFWDTMPSKF